VNWFNKIIPPKIKSRAASGLGKRGVPEGLWSKCSSCDAVLYRAELERNLQVCPKCGHHLRLGARARLQGFLDEGEQREIGGGVRPSDMLKFRDTRKYKDRLSDMQKETGESDALVVVEGLLKGMPLVAACFEFRFMGGSMGSVVGERFVRGVENAAERFVPMVCFCASGGARMQESLFSLMQMSKTAAALKRLSAQRIPYITVLTDPTMGGVSASLAMLGDIIIAEPGALVGFAGPRVIEQTVRETLPDGFQKSEFLLSHGAIDRIVDRRRMRDTVHRLLHMLLSARGKAQ